MANGDRRRVPATLSPNPGTRGLRGAGMEIERPARAIAPARYRPRHPSQSVLYRCVQERFKGLGSPRGVLARGFARARCGDGGHDFLIAFSCKGGGVCPRYCGKRPMSGRIRHPIRRSSPPQPRVRSAPYLVANSCARPQARCGRKPCPPPPTVPVVITFCDFSPLLKNHARYRNFRMSASAHNHCTTSSRRIAAACVVEYPAEADLERVAKGSYIFRYPARNALSKSYAASLCSKINPNQASVVPGPNLGGGTVNLMTADRWGNMASVVHSVFNVFGSRISVPGYGFVLHDRGSGFTRNQSSPNAVAPASSRSIRSLRPS